MTAHEIRTGSSRRSPLVLRDARGRFARVPVLSAEARGAAQKLLATIAKGESNATRS